MDKRLRLLWAASIYALTNGYSNIINMSRHDYLITPMVTAHMAEHKYFLLWLFLAGGDLI